ncbi:MAG TPA: Sir2 family NAD-dependent protein deacetylase [Spirochaetia bacterium]|nr:Sir2 family NAD-dependent protein deacetylase [Spirochaetia bacterium]
MHAPDVHSRITAAAALIRSARHLTAFTGAGISVESGIPPFRGPGGLWNTYDPRMLELDAFLAHPENAWPVIKEIFYDHFGKAKPNDAHRVLAWLEKRGPGADGLGRLKCLITQNIDNLHYLAGSRAIVEFHGNSRLLLCLDCGKRVEARPYLLSVLPPRCSCGGLYKPDFIFFGEGIPPEAHRRSELEAGKSDVMLIVGSTGEVYPAALVPRWAKEAGAAIIEINPAESEFTGSITDIHIPGKAAEAFRLLEKELAS